MRTTVVVCLLLLLAAAVSADPPQTLSYQGVLRDGSGDAVADGNYDITFKLYTLATGGTALWTETQSVAVADGIFDVVLGSVTPFTTVTFNFPYWLGVTVAGDLEMTPRTELTSAPYAIRAIYTDIPSDNDWAFAGDNIYRLAGKVGIGTNDPYEELHVVGDAEVNGTLTATTLAATTITSPVPPEPVEAGAPEEAEELRKPAKGGKHKLEVATPIDPTTRQQSLQLQTEGTTRVHLDGVTGYVGVGTETPGARLDVEGTLEATGIRMPTGAADNRVLTSDPTGNSSWQLWSEGRVGNIEYADQYQDQFDAGDAGGPIRAAILALPADGGVVDARGIRGGDVSLNLFDGVEKSVTLLLGAGTYRFTIPQVISQNGQNDGRGMSILGQGPATVLVPDVSMTMFTVDTIFRFRLADLSFDLNNMNATAVFLHRVRWYGAALERLFLENHAGTAPMIRVGVTPEGESAIGTVLRDLILQGTMTADGIDIGCEMVVVDHCAIDYCEAAIRMHRGTSATISNNALGFNRHQVVIEEATYNTVRIFGNDLEAGAQSQGHIRVIGSSPESPMHNLIVRDNFFTQLNSPDIDAIYLKNVVGVVIEGNRFGGGFQGSGASSVVFESNVSDVCISGNIVENIEPTMPGYDTVAGLPVNDVTATQASSGAGFGNGLAVSGVLAARDLMNIAPRDSAPAAPVEGDVYMDGLTHKLMVYDGTSWRACW